MGIPLDDRLFGRDVQDAEADDSAIRERVELAVKEAEERLARSVEEFRKVSEAYNKQLSSFYTAEDATPAIERSEPPARGERLLLLLLSKEERANIPGDLAEEFAEIASKHGARYAKLWYYKQVAASAWPMLRKAAGWGLLASIGAWIRRLI